jgi:hypothetical protein
MSDETITLQEWVEAIQDVASIEKELLETSNPQRQQILFQARKEAVERVLAMRFLTGATTARIEIIIETEPWASAFYDYLSKENEDDLGRAHSQAGALLRESEEPPPDSGELSSWYSGASPFGKAR